ncbi:MAG: XisH family protein [Chamaesiphon sp.]|nr:XisH family protein [Chamaesiphon sp.]
MSAKDIFHDVVKEALEREQWIITHDPNNEVLVKWTR